MTTIDHEALAHVSGGGPKDAAFCSQLRATGMQFGKGVAGGKVADKLLPSWVPDGSHAGVSQVGGSIIGGVTPGLIAKQIDSELPSFCKRSGPHPNASSRSSGRMRQTHGTCCQPSSPNGLRECLTRAHAVRWWSCRCGPARGRARGTGPQATGRGSRCPLIVDANRGLCAMVVGAALVMVVAGRRPEPARARPVPATTRHERPWLTHEAAAQIIGHGGRLGPLFVGVVLGGPPPRRRSARGSPRSRARTTSTSISRSSKERSSRCVSP